MDGRLVDWNKYLSIQKILSIRFLSHSLCVCVFFIPKYFNNFLSSWQNEWKNLIWMNVSCPFNSILTVRFPFLMYRNWSRWNNTGFWFWEWLTRKANHCMAFIAVKNSWKLNPSWYNYLHNCICFQSEKMCSSPFSPLQFCINNLYN